MSDLAEFIDVLAHNRTKRNGPGVYASDKVMMLLDEVLRLRKLANAQCVMISAPPADEFESIHRAFAQQTSTALVPLDANPPGFVWIDRPVTVTGGDYSYSGQRLLSFPKAVGGAVRYIVRDQNSRLFIHNAVQCGLEG